MQRVVGFGFKSAGELQTPFGLHLGDAQEGGTHERDDDGSDQTEGTFPDVFGGAPFVFAEGVKDSNESGADDEADSEADQGTEPDLGMLVACCGDWGGDTNLVSELLVESFVLVWSDLLLDEGKEDRDDDASLGGLAEDDEEDRDCENIDHDAGGAQTTR